MSKPIETHTHQDERTNIPTPELELFMDEEHRKPILVEFDRRNKDLDPQLIWRGKSITDNTFTVPAPPLYLQEQVHPKALIEDLRSGRVQDNELFGDLFSHFGVEEEDLEKELEFYQHSKKWSNRMILGDSLQVMSSLGEREGLRGQVQCIYIDPPYGIKFNSNFQWSTSETSVQDGKLDHLTREPEQVKAFRDTWRQGIHSYLSYLRDRLLLSRELLSESGSLFVQIGDENVHRIRSLLDEVFGAENFVSQITYKSSVGMGEKYLDNVGTFILWYAKDREKLKYRPAFKELKIGEPGALRYLIVDEVDGVERRCTPQEAADYFRTSQYDPYFKQGLTSRTGSETIQFEVLHNGQKYVPTVGGWRSNVSGLERVQMANRITIEGRRLTYRRRFGDFPYTSRDNIWDDISGGIKSRSDPKIYVVQTSTSVIERCLLMTTDPGDLVLDPTCGAGTTAFVAEQWGRRWVAIDTSRVALALAKSRLMGAKFPYFILSDSEEGQLKEAELTQLPESLDRPQYDIRRGFVYDRAPHITLKSIAKNAEIEVIFARYSEDAKNTLSDLNRSLLGQKTPFEIKHGGRSGQFIDFAAKEGETFAMESGELAPKNGFMEWEVPREPNTPWPQDELKLLDKAKKLSKSGNPTAAAKRALNELNLIRNSNWTYETLPKTGATSWPAEAAEALEAFWRVRISRQNEIDSSIAVKAESEFLYDKPYDDPKRVRVAGPFTVESLSPHRTPIVGPNDELIDLLDASRGDRDAPEGESEAYYKAMIENLKASGVHQQDKGDRISFTSIEPWAGHYIGAEGRYIEGSEEEGTEAERRAAIVIGPEYGSVRRADLIAAGREATEAGFDILIICAFNFDTHSDVDRLGPLPILRARMNPDLHMAGELKEGGGNLFVVFGEPDIELLDAPGDRLKVKINGVDVFKPQTGEVESTGPEGIACWFVDTDYSGESFFVRQAYFLGANDPYKSLKTTLKDEIDEEAWASLNSDVSRSFKRPESGKIAVKAINHLGDEVMKVFEV